MTVTPEEFMAQTADPDEDTEVSGVQRLTQAAGCAGDALSQLAESMQAIAQSFTTMSAVAEEVSTLRTRVDDVLQDLADTEAKQLAYAELVDRVLEVVKPSTSKLANSVRDVVNDFLQGEPEEEPKTSAETGGGYSSGPSLPSANVMLGNRSPKRRNYRCTKTAVGEGHQHDCDQPASHPLGAQHHCPTCENWWELDAKGDARLANYEGDEPAGEGTRIVPPAVRCADCHRYFADTQLLDAHACTAPPVEEPRTGALPQPTDDAPVSVWGRYAESLGHTVLGNMNRSQIRTMLGLAHPSEGADQ